MTKKIIYSALIILLIILLIIISINYFIKLSVKKYFIDDLDSLSEYDCILVLGASIWGDEPSPMLKDRLDKSIELYNLGVSKKIIMSGEHLNESYDEVNVMKDYAIKHGVPSSAIFMDPKGISTYDSIYRAKEVYQAKKILIVTQKYHLYRSLYIASSLGITSFGIDAKSPKYKGDLKRELREILARNKEFVKCIFKPKSTYIDEAIPITGNGDVTNDKKI